MKKSALIATLTICFLASSCLKTRAELKEEQHDGPGTEDTSSAPQAAKVKDVEPQGSYAMDEVKGELTRINGRLEDLERANQDAAAKSTAAGHEETKKLEARIIELEHAQADMLEAIKKLQDTRAVAADPAEAFETAKHTFRSENYDIAIEQLSNYLKTPKGQHAEEATYLRGESYFQLKQYKKAIVDFSKFPEKYTKSKLLPTALLRIGQSFDALGMKEDASGFYQELLDKFPKSPEAKKARAKSK